MADSDGAPGSLRWVVDYLNTADLESGSDEVATPEALAAWFAERQFIPAGAAVGPAEHARAMRLREGLRALVAASSDPDAAGNAPPVAELAGLARGLPLVLDVTSDPPTLVPARPGTPEGALGWLLAAVARAAADGTWTRLKVCRNPGCRWAYYDRSRNRSREWCSMSVCGNRAKARAFRSRARHGGPGETALARRRARPADSA
jgi:predicted RNA-binding Zn ribbon-like protein